MTIQTDYRTPCALYRLKSKKFSGLEPMQRSLAAWNEYRENLENSKAGWEAFYSPSNLASMIEHPSTPKDVKQFLVESARQRAIDMTDKSRKYWGESGIPEINSCQQSINDVDVHLYRFEQVCGGWEEGEDGSDVWVSPNPRFLTLDKHYEFHEQTQDTIDKDPVALELWRHNRRDELNLITMRKMDEPTYRALQKEFEIEGD